MANYKETTVAGSSYTRCNQLLISNRLGIAPKIRFDEQVVVSLESGGSIVTGSGNIEIDFDANKQIPLLDTTTGEATGQTVSYAMAYTILHSAYIAAALERDAAQAAQGE